MLNPCFDYCYVRFGNQYTPECDSKCEFARTVKVLKEVLLFNEGCFATCKNSHLEKCEWTCDKYDEECKNHSLYQIDFDRVIEDYSIKL